MRYYKETLYYPANKLSVKVFNGFFFAIILYFLEGMTFFLS